MHSHRVSFVSKDDASSPSLMSFAIDFRLRRRVRPVPAPLYQDSTATKSHPRVAFLGKGDLTFQRGARVLTTPRLVEANGAHGGKFRILDAQCFEIGHFVDVGVGFNVDAFAQTIRHDAFDLGNG